MKEIIYTYEKKETIPDYKRLDENIYLRIVDVRKLNLDNQT